jgi:hypothetical protein
VFLSSYSLLSNNACIQHFLLPTAVDDAPRLPALDAINDNLRDGHCVLPHRFLRKRAPGRRLGPDRADARRDPEPAEAVDRAGHERRLRGACYCARAAREPLMRCL